jgi:hypothetical protein
MKDFDDIKMHGTMIKIKKENNYVFEKASRLSD